MQLIRDLAAAAGAAVGSSRPVAEQLRYVPLNRYVGMSGQKFTGNLYIACGISGAVQHLKGIKDATTIVAINTNANAPIFKNADYGIVGDVKEITLSADGTKAEVKLKNENFSKEVNIPSINPGTLVNPSIAYSEIC